MNVTCISGIVVGQRVFQVALAMARQLSEQVGGLMLSSSFLCVPDLDGSFCFLLFSLWVGVVLAWVGSLCGRSELIESGPIFV